MSKVLQIGVIIFSLCYLSGCCNPDSRLNGEWAGSLWQNRKEIENTQITFEFHNGTFKLSQKAGNIVFNFHGSYTTDVEKFPNQISFIIIQEGRTDTNYRKGIYRFNFPIFFNTLYIAITQSEEEDYPSIEKLDPDVGPVLILKKK